MPTTVREATELDAEAIARVHTLSWQSAYRGLVPDSYLDGLKWERRYEQWARLLPDRPTAHSSVFVAVDSQDVVVGFSSMGPVREKGLEPTGLFEIYAIYVLPGMWGRAFGHRLLEASLAALPQGVPGVTLWVLSGNARGRRFYERAGFGPDGATKLADIAGEELPELRYRLDLS
ncbi:MAG TPA: GNAT family N-acetyltransferase [Candidatus Nanopelagicales bacterium]